MERAIVPRIPHHFVSSEGYISSQMLEPSIPGNRSEPLGGIELCAVRDKRIAVRLHSDAHAIAWKKANLSLGPVPELLGLLVTLTQLDPSQRRG